MLGLDLRFVEKSLPTHSGMFVSFSLCNCRRRTRDVINSYYWGTGNKGDSEASKNGSRQCPNDGQGWG